jgi:predicted RNase H-like nuclease (RuvC/YqgF family)
MSLPPINFQTSSQPTQDAPSPRQALRATQQQLAEMTRKYQELQQVFERYQNVQSRGLEVLRRFSNTHMQSIDELTEENEGLRKRVAELEQGNSSSSSVPTITNLSNQITQHKNQNEQLNRALQKARDQFVEVRNRFEKAWMELETEKKKNSDLAQENSQLKTVIQNQYELMRVQASNALFVNQLYAQQQPDSNPQTANLTSQPQQTQQQMDDLDLQNNFTSYGPYQQNQQNPNQFQ